MAWRRRRCLPRCWSANIAITRHSTGSRRSSPAMGSIFRVRRSPDGSAAPAGGSRRCTNALQETCLLRITCSPMTRPCRCSIQAEGARRRDGFGFTPASKEHGVGQSRRPRSICMRRTAKLNVRLRISNTSAAFFMSTAMPGSSRWRIKGMSCSPHAGATRDASSTKWRRPRTRRSR